MSEVDFSNLFANSPVFEWDDNKRRSNIDKHGIDFADAKEALYDPGAFTFVSPRSSHERRYITVGSLGGTLITVIFTLRGGAVRIISARAARRVEKELYGSKPK
jgi:uncharacterized protein